MFGAGKKLIRRLKRSMLGDEGSATVEFVILFPAIMTLFLSSFEISIYLMRSTLLDRALDVNVRALRLGELAPGASNEAKQDELKRRVCQAALFFNDCPNAITIEVTPVSTIAWDLPSSKTACVDRAAPTPPSVGFSLGTENNLMLVRACAVLDPFFGTTPLIMDLPVDATGGYAVTAASIFVNEPG